MAVRQQSRHERTEDPAGQLSAAELLDLFGDEYTRRVFEAVSERPRGGRAVAQAADVSRATAYRRLNELRDAGLVTSEYQFASDGHHREQFTARARHLSVSLDGGDIEAAVSVDD
ncbi:winged helix-turn-helix domain-containing protein [Halorubrum sp. SD626R]|jgi:predicted transcriptional regulator|uniref:winged helix-turn-helix domain-containing protein n=1 Tax=Halorubrum sp. SD626R TaxID=1419722 RepID=UPI000A713501|nr:winged helix-turn-helix domain-containing protein [Halorubrum sp. SD626R]TKX81891.1 ArsR family transcriptional regulator [Halorubrum sp. SD626R]